MKIGMAIVCRDENDIIAQNIAFHYYSGVSQFVVIDNASIDGTNETLERLKRIFPVKVIIEHARDRQMNTWLDRACRILIEDGCSWIIPNDADEFWWTPNLDLASTIPPFDSIVNVKRSNLFLDKDGFESGVSCFLGNIRITDLNPWGISPERCLQPDCPVLPVLWGPIGSKVIFPARGFERLAFGNHGVAFNYGIQTVESDKIHIYHYPFRSRRQLINKIIKHGEELATGDYSHTYKSWHLRYLLRQYNEGRIEEVIQTMLVSNEESEKGVTSGWYVVDNNMSIVYRENPNRFNV